MTPKSVRKGHRKIPGRETYSRLWFNLKQIPLFSYSRTNRLRRGDREVYSSARSPGLENSFLNGGGQIKIFFENFKMAVVWRERRFVKTHRVFSRVFSGLWLFSSGIRGYSAQNAPVFPEPLSRQIAVWNFVTHVYCPLPSFKSAFSLQNTSSPGSPHSSFSSSLPSLWFTSPTLRVVREFENKGICPCFIASDFFPTYCTTTFPSCSLSEFVLNRRCVWFHFERYTSFSIYSICLQFPSFLSSSAPRRIAGFCLNPFSLHIAIHFLPFPSPSYNSHIAFHTTEAQKIFPLKHKY